MDRSKQLQTRAEAASRTVFRSSQLELHAAPLTDILYDLHTNGPAILHRQCGWIFSLGELLRGVNDRVNQQTVMVMDKPCLGHNKPASGQHRHTTQTCREQWPRQPSTSSRKSGFHAPLRMYLAQWIGCHGSRAFMRQSLEQCSNSSVRPAARPFLRTAQALMHLTDEQRQASMWLSRAATAACRAARPRKQRRVRCIGPHQWSYADRQTYLPSGALLCCLAMEASVYRRVQRHQPALCT